MLAGEWAVLEPGNRCLVLAVARYVTGTITKSQQISIALPDLELPPCIFQWQAPNLIPPVNHPMPADPRSHYCLTAVAKTLSFLQEIGIHVQPFALTITSTISSISTKTGQQGKPGLGSSAATVVATVTSIFAFHNQDITMAPNKEIIFKLAALTHYEVQGYRGSCFDVATASMGTSIMYQRFDPDWLIHAINTSQSLTDIIKIPWPGLVITPLQIPSPIFILLGFTGTGAKTTGLIKIIENFKQKHKEKYQAWCTKIMRIVDKLHAELQRKNTQHILTLIRENQKLLQELSSHVNNILIPPTMQTLITLAEQEGAAAKIAGAGGGDCGIALCPNEKCKNTIKKKWQDHNILPLEMEIL